MNIAQCAVTMMVAFKAQRDLDKGPNAHIIPPALNLTHSTLDENTRAALITLRDQHIEDTKKLFQQSVAATIRDSEEAVTDILRTWVQQPLHIGSLWELFST